jgi:hypothetical protein
LGLELVRHRLVKWIFIVWGLKLVIVNHPDRVNYEAVRRNSKTPQRIPFFARAAPAAHKVRSGTALALNY